MTPTTIIIARIRHHYRSVVSNNFKYIIKISLPVSHLSPEADT